MAESRLLAAIILAIAAACCTVKLCRDDYGRGWRDGCYWTEYADELRWSNHLRRCAGLATPRYMKGDNDER